MKKIENYENIEATTGEHSRPTAGGYACKIIDVEDVAMNPQTGKGDYLKIDYDIAFGDFNGSYKKQFDRWGGYWKANFIRSYKEKAQGMFKHFINVAQVCSLDDIENGNFKVPPKKTLKKAVDPMANIAGFEPMPDNVNDIPF